MGVSFFTAAVTISSDFGAQDNKPVTVFIVSPCIFHEVMEWDAMIFVFLICTYHINTILKKKKCKNVVCEGLTNNLEKKRSKIQRRIERHTHLNAEFQKIARRDF